MSDREGIISLADRRLARERASGRPGMPATHSEPTTARSRTPIAAAFCAAVMLVVIGLLTINKLEGMSVLNLPGSAREELASHGLDQLRTTCGGAAGPTEATRDHCQAQARLLMMLPECKGGCQTEAAMVLSSPRR
jgi:hypothetical protein